MNFKNDLDKYLVIINQNEPLTQEKEEWFKENFEYVPYRDEDGESCMELETFKAYTSLVKLMREKYHIVVDSHSAWRSIATQEKVYQDMLKIHTEDWVKDHVAIPGASEHHTGLAFDIRFKHILVPEFLRSKANAIAKATGKRKKIFEIIEKEAVQFGLIKRYPKDKQLKTGVREEDWHFRYVGVEHAKAMYESGMCLEEYVKELRLKSSKTKEAVR